MATQTIKTTYSLDVDTVRKLEQMARRWNVSKSEALRRAIRTAADRGSSDEDSDALSALNELQESVGLTPDEAAAWRDSARSEREASSSRRDGRIG